MNKVAFIFPGQGSQFIGMGKDLALAFPEAKELFQEVDDALSQKLSKLMFEGDPEELTRTQNAQPALMAVSAAALRVLERQCNIRPEQACAFLAGHSLGEYSALYAAGSLNLRDAALILKIRGEAMSNAATKAKGAMLALLGATEESAKAVVAESKNYGICQIANDNGAGQFVLSGEEKAIDHVILIAPNHDIKRAIKLNVSGAFHSELMKPAEIELAAGLADIGIKKAKIPVVANFTALPVEDAEEIRELLIKQVSGMVKWRQSMGFILSQGVTRFIEIGAGKVLSTIAKRMSSDIEVLNVQNPEDIEKISLIS